MNRIKILLIVSIISIFMFSSNANAYVSLTFSSSTVPSTIEPGTKANILITISNTGNEIATNAKISIQATSNVIPDSPSYSLGTLNAGGSTQITVPITVSPNAQEGTVAIPVTVSYSISGSGSTTDSQNSVSIVITKRTLLQITEVSYDKPVIQRGDVFKMTLNIQNVGKGQIKDLVASIRNFASAISPATTDTEKFLGVFGSGDNKSVSFDLTVNNNADTIAYSVPVILDFYDEQGIAHSDVKYVGLRISGIPDFVVYVESSEITADSKGKVVVSVANAGTGTSKFLTAYAKSDIALLPATVYIGNLDPDDTNSLSFETSYPSSGNHKLNLTLVYKDSYNQEFSNSYDLNFNFGPRAFKIPAVFQFIIALLIIFFAYKNKNTILKMINGK
ncbi:MAG TPA: CARDB domain-containing protein [archaeon]|nr:CARDB domain-containing protein [archaeon]